MKSQIIRLEHHDDVASAADKIVRSQSDRVLLVWPIRPAFLGAGLDLTRLNRLAAASGIRLAIVSRRSDVAHYATQLNIPVFRNIRMAQQIPWEAAPPPPVHTRPAQRKVRPPRPASITKRPLPRPVRLAAFAFGLLSALAIFAIFIPRATITVSPVRQPQTLQVALIADPSVSSFHLTGILPLEIARVTVEGRSATPTTGETGIPFAAATGEIQFTNLTENAVAIPAGTIIRTAQSPAVRFLTTRSVSLAASPGAQVTAPIEAESPGGSGNLSAGALAVVEGDLALRISATNPEPTAGGQDQVSRAPATEDYDTLRAALIASLWQSALEDAAENGLTSGLVLATQPGEIEILAEEFSPPPSQPADELALTLRLRFAIPYIPQNQLDAFARATLDASLPAGYSPLEGTLIASTLDIPTQQEDGTYEAATLLSRTIQTSLPSAQIVSLVLGRQPDSATNALVAAFNLASPPQITLQPDWLPILPLMPWQIQVDS